MSAYLFFILVWTIKVKISKNIYINYIEIFTPKF